MSPSPPAFATCPLKPWRRRKASAGRQHSPLTPALSPKGRGRRRGDGEDGARLLVVDNRDSFVFNLVDEFRRRGAEVLTLRSHITLEKLEEHLGRFRPHGVVLSPGPGHPEEAGIMVPWLRSDPRVPVLGVCLGHQALAVAAGGRVDTAPKLLHGRASRIFLQPDPLFEGLPSSLVAGRYHSLVVAEVPESMMVIASTRDNGNEVVMGIRHRFRPRVGLQFHPESILTPQGGQILWNFVREALLLPSPNLSPTGRGKRRGMRGTRKST
jgi:anthranilate synthase component 2